MKALRPLDCTTTWTRFVLFTGKGGVGKTTVAAATAIALADTGLRVLLVSTDPASNLGDVFEMTTGGHPQPVRAVPGLDVMDLDPQVAADEYRARVVDPYRNVLPTAQISALEEKLAGACTVEVAAFDTFARLLAEPELVSEYDHVLFDTAPTGHTLRLLSLPAAWSDYLSANPDATSCLGPLGGVQDHRPTYAAAVATLRDATLTTVVLVARPDVRAFAVAESAVTELHELGIGHEILILNGVLAHPLAGDDVAEEYASRQQTALAQLPAPLDEMDAMMVPLVAVELVGVDALRWLIRGPAPLTEASVDNMPHARVGGVLDDLIDDLAHEGRGVILVTGKGGVGKTTIARLLAVELARRGSRVHLSTTDPAGVIPAAQAELPALTTSAIDPQAVTRNYVAERLATAARRGMDQAQLDLLEEDLRSPCSQELAVFQKFSQLLRRGNDEFVVIDTAPTGHTLLLLDVTGSFHRQVLQSRDLPPGRVHTPLMRLQDPNHSKLLIVTLAETTPVSEAADLQDDLRRARIEPYGWIVNATLSDSGTADPVLRARAALEESQISRIRRLTSRIWTLPWRADL